jgi:hypothetical protein
MTSSQVPSIRSPTPDLGRFDQKLYLSFNPIVDQDGGARGVGFEIRLAQISSFSVSPRRSR